MQYSRYNAGIGIAMMAVCSSVDKLLFRKVFLIWSVQSIPPAFNKIRSNSAKNELNALVPYRKVLNFRAARSADSRSSYAIYS